MACRPVFLRVATAFLVMALLAPSASASDWAPREDMGVAAVDTWTGKVVWEAWRLDEVPVGASKEEKTAVEYLLAWTRNSVTPLPHATPLPDLSLKGLEVKNPWPKELDEGRAIASEGMSLIYYRQGTGVIALDRNTKKEVWRLETKRFPYPSHVLEAGDHQALIQIGSDVPATIQTALVGGLRMGGLLPHTLKQRVAAAILLHHYGDGYLRPEVKKLAEQLSAEKNDPAVITASKSVEKLLAHWPKVRNRQRLLEGCVSAILGAGEDNPLNDFAWPGAHRILTWCLFQELLYGRPRDAYGGQGYNYAYDEGNEQPLPLPEATKAKLLDYCRKVAVEGPASEIPFAASVLVSTGIGWSKLTDGERKALFLSSDPSAWRWAALGLSKNGQRKELMEWARERPVDDHLDVVCLLKRDRKGWPEEELRFWVASAQHNPGGVAYVLRNSHELPAPIEFREPIRAYLEREITKPTVADGGTQPAYSLSAAVTVLDSWKHADDTFLLLEYLKHPVHTTGTGPTGTVHNYQLRALVRDLLEKRGTKIPPNVVYKETGPAEK
jgi:hypothetical protein